MKYFLLALVVISSVTACNKPVKGRNGITYKNAVEYNDYIVSRQTKLMRNVLDFGKTAETNLDSAESMLGRFANETDQMIREIKGMPAFKGDSVLRDAAVKSFTFYKRVFAQDYVDILNIRKKESEITEADISELDRIVDKISKEEENFDKSFHEAQRNFASKNNMRLKDNEIQKEIDNSGN